MSTAAEGAAAKNASTYESGGVGGKLPKRQSRRYQTTPYDRPPTALRNPSWLSKLVVDPASKLISAGAQCFFSSIFRKRLLPPPASPPQPPEDKQESMNGHQKTIPDKNHTRAQELAGNEGGNPSSGYDNSGASELEELLNQKTFTRSEIDRLTQLLHSRAVDLPGKDAGKGIDANFTVQNATHLNPVSESVSFGKFPISLEGSNNIERARAPRVISNHSIGKALHEGEIASPTELAKAYMGSRSSELSPSKLGCSQTGREEAVLINTMPVTLISPNTSLAVKTPVNLGTPVNGSTLQRFRGRSAIYNMARTPYSRVHSTSIQQVSGSTSHRYTRSSSSASQPAWNDGQLGSRPVASKRRSSVLDNDIGSFGPVRRIRQKSNLLSHGSSISARGAGLGSSICQLPKFPPTDESKNRVSNTAISSYAHVPPKSCEMAARILEHLEKMTPKEKSSESKLAAARERSPVKLTPNMLRGKALRSLEDLDASNFLQNTLSEHTMADQSIYSLPGSRDSAAQKQGKVEENGPSNLVVKSTPVLNTDITVSIKDIKASAVTADAATLKSVAQSSERKRAFKMSAHEDFLELDDDAHSTVPTSASLDERQGVMDKSMINGKSIPSKDVELDKTPVFPELRTLPPADLSKATELATCSAAPAGEKLASFTFSSSNEFSKGPRAELHSHSTSAADKSTTVGDAPPFLSFGSKTVGKVPSLMEESKAENSSSSVNASADATNAPADVLKLDTNGTKSFQQEDGIVNGNSASSLESSSMSTTTSIFSTGAPSSNLVTDSGPLASSMPSWSTKRADQNFTNCSSNMVSSSSAKSTFSDGGTSSTSSTFNSGLAESNVAPSIFSAPAFSFQSSKEPSSSFSATSTIANAGNTDLKVKAEKETSFGNPSAPSIPSVSPESSTFGLGSFLASSGASSQLQVSLTGSGSALSTQPSSAGSAVTTVVSESMPVQFGSPSSPLGFGSSGIPSFTSSSIFSSSTPTAFSVSGTSSAQISSASTTETNLVSSSIFKFGVGSSASASESNAVTTSGVTPATFTFGVSSAPSSTPSSSVTPGFFSFGASSSVSSSATSGSSTTTAMFSFGVSSSVSSSSSTSSTFGFGASPSALSSGANSVSSAGANSSPFGSSWQSTNSPLFGSTLNISSPSTGFSFGASSSSFGATNSAAGVFGSTSGPSSSPIFPFSAASATSSSLSTSVTQTVFGGNPTSAFAGAGGNNDQMNTEDSMAEDPVQSMPVAPVFGQSPVTPSPQSFMFGSSVPSPAVSFQFGGQQNQAAPQNPSQFQASSSLELNAGGSFSLGSSGPDKSGRRMVKINKNRNRKR